jgi:hypothetical protein
MPIIAGRASAAYGAGFGKVLGSAFAPVGAFDALSTVVASSGNLSSITFAGIPQTGYSHLQIRGIARSSAGADNTVMQFNDDTSAVYATHYMIGNGSTASNGNEFNTSRFYIDVVGTNASAASWSADIIDILDYSNTSKFKTVRTLAGQDLNGSGTVWAVSGLWRSTTGISSIKIAMNGAASFAQYSSFTLYGVK